ncbi:hypothetical protein Acr_08g0008610 [Actinidia rufa]|uniref:Uncharacterized protein n=1 Tax=Actinidia rufa TaxID=165716 RepID=A0A7J0F197_9ERIC|nr:hypothetical protein Acr_08g0008610 [Actinidia rufa]
MWTSVTSGGFRFLRYRCVFLPPVPVAPTSSPPSPSLLTSFRAPDIMVHSNIRSSSFSFAHSGRSGGRGRGMEMRDNHERSRGRGSGSSS